jgi:hypothetical protein
MSNQHAACGRPAFAPTNKQRQTVEVLVANGNSQRVIALVIGCDRTTLRKHFREELRDGREVLGAQMGLAIVRAGLAGDWRAAAYWLARFGGSQWRLPSPRIEVASSIDVTHARDVTKMTDEEIESALAEIERQRAATRGDEVALH